MKLNLKQKGILWGYVVAMLVTLVYVPWLVPVHPTATANLTGVIFRRGWAFIMSLQDGWKIDFEQMLAQWICLTLVTVALLFIFKDEEPAAR